jgi:hypothetical protein
MAGTSLPGRRHCAVLLATLTMLPAAPDARAAEWFVSTSGSDTGGDGSIGAPFRTLGHVLDPGNAIVAANDTVTLRGPVGANVYDECEVRLRVPLTLRSRDGEWAHIRCDLAIEDAVTVQVDPDASGSRLSRIELSGGSLYALFLQTDWDQTGNPGGRGASNVTVEDCVIHDSGRDAIKITPKSDDVTIRRCEIHHTGRIYPPGTPVEEKNAEGIDNVNGARMRVEDSHVHDTATNGIYFKGGATDVLIQRNVVENTGEGGILVGFDTSPEFFDLTLNPGYYEAIRGIVRNNIVRHTGRAGIGLYASRDALIANNTILDAARIDQAAIYFGVTLQDFAPEAGRPATTNPRIVNNLVQQIGGDCVAIRWANEIDADGLHGLAGPTGMDYNWFDDTAARCVYRDTRPGSTLDAGGDFAAWRLALVADANSHDAPIDLAADGHLLASSGAIDAGTTVPGVVEDIDREARAAPFDVGADELNASLLFHNGFE